MSAPHLLDAPDLAARIRSREREALTAVVEAYLDQVVRAARGAGLDQQQAEEVDKVKRSESGMIVDPITLPPSATVGDAEAIMSKYHISGVPITQDGEKLVGILTNRDVRFVTDMGIPIHQLMTPAEGLVTWTAGNVSARDPATGMLGVAVQSHWFSVGSSVPWAESGVGAVATQSFIDPSYGALGLALMRTGRSAEQTLAGLVEADPSPEVRQVGMVDASGSTAAYTGSLAIQHACDRQGAAFTVQANLMHHDGVCDAMFVTFNSAPGDLAARLMAALEAAESAEAACAGAEKATTSRATLARRPMTLDVARICISPFSERGRRSVVSRNGRCARGRRHSGGRSAARRPRRCWPVARTAGP